MPIHGVDDRGMVREATVGLVRRMRKMAEASLGVGTLAGRHSDG